MDSAIAIVVVLNLVVSALTLSIVGYQRIDTSSKSPGLPGSHIFKKKREKLKPIVNDDEKQWQREQREKTSHAL